MPLDITTFTLVDKPTSLKESLAILERDPLVVYWRWPRTEGTSRPSPASGVGLEFRETKPHFRTVLQRWILAEMHQQKKP